MTEMWMTYPPPPRKTYMYVNVYSQNSQSFFKIFLKCCLGYMLLTFHNLCYSLCYAQNVIVKHQLGSGYLQLRLFQPAVPTSSKWTVRQLTEIIGCTITMCLYVCTATTWHNLPKVISLSKTQKITMRRISTFMLVQNSIVWQWILR